MHALQLLEQQPHTRVKIEIITDKEKDKRIYNKPTNKEIAVLITNMGDFDVPNKPQGLVYFIKLIFCLLYQRQNVF